MEPWLIGMQLALLGCFSSAVGLILLKHSTSVESHLPLYKRKFWLIGIVFLIVNASVIDVFAFSLAPITLIAPFTGVTIVFTSWLASTGVLFVKETLDMWDATSTTITLVGVTVSSIYGPHSTDAPDSSNIFKYFGSPDFLACAGFLLSILAVGWALLGINASSILRGSRDPKPASPREAALRIVLYAYTAALSGSMSMLTLKVIGSGLRATMEKNARLITPQWLFCFCGLGFFAAIQLGFLHRTLANSPVTYGVPTYQTLLTLLTILLGGIFFSEFKEMGMFQMLVFCSGVAVALFGIALHTGHRAQTGIEQQGPPPQQQPGGVQPPPGSTPNNLASAAEEGAAGSSDVTPYSRQSKSANETTRLLGSS